MDEWGWEGEERESGGSLAVGWAALRLGLDGGVGLMGLVVIGLGGGLDWDGEVCGGWCWLVIAGWVW